MIAESEDPIPEEPEGGGEEEVPFRQLADKTLLSPVSNLTPLLIIFEVVVQGQTTPH